MTIHSLNLVVDLNHDGSYSLWELWEAAKFIYRLPGNLFVEGLGHIPYVSSLLHIHASQATGYDSLNGLLSVTLTLIFWILVVFSVLTICSPTVDEIDDPEDNAASPSQYRQYASESDDTARAITHASVQGSAPTHMHLPVSRAIYAAPGKKPKRRPWHRCLKSVAH